MSGVQHCVRESALSRSKAMFGVSLCLVCLPYIVRSVVTECHSVTSSRNGRVPSESRQQCPRCPVLQQQNSCDVASQRRRDPDD